MSRPHPRIFYINLESRTDRRAFMERQLTKAGVAYERFPAVRPSIASLVEPDGEFHRFFKRASVGYKKLSRNKHNNEEAIPYFGVYLSHYLVHQKMANEPGRDYIILEDDCLFERSNLEKLLDMIECEAIPEDWDIVRDCWDSTDTVRKFENSNHNSRFSGLRNYHNYYGGAHFNLFRSNSTAKLIEFLDEDTVFTIDGVYSTHMMNVYHYDFGFHPAGLGSDIPKQPEKSRFDRKLMMGKRLAGRLFG